MRARLPGPLLRCMLAAALAAALAAGTACRPAGTASRGTSGVGGVADQPAEGGSGAGADDAGPAGETWRATLVERLGGAPGTVFCAAGWSKDVVAAIDARTDAKGSDRPVARMLMYLALKPDGSELWGTPEYWDSREGVIDAPVTIVDPATGKTKGTVDAAHAGKVAFTPDGKRAYVTLIGGDRVAVYDAATRRLLKQIKVGKHPFAIAISFDGTRAYVGHGPAIKGVNRRFKGYGIDILLPDMERGADHIAVIDLTTDEVIGRVDLGGWSSGVAVSPDGRVVYATVSSIDVTGLLSGSSGQPKGGAWDGVAVIDARSLKLVKKLPFPKESGPKGVAFVPGGKKAYTICGATDVATPIDVTTHRLGKAIPLGLGG